MRSTWYVWGRKISRSIQDASKPISYSGVIRVWKEESLGWTLTFELCSVIFNPRPSVICQRLMRASCRIDKKRKWKQFPGETGNLFPRLVLISPRWVYFTPTHKQSVAHRRWRGETRMKDACRTAGCCWDPSSLSDDEDGLSSASLCGKFTWNSLWIHVVLLDLMLFGKYDIWVWGWFFLKCKLKEYLLARQAELNSVIHAYLCNEPIMKMYCIQESQSKVLMLFILFYLHLFLPVGLRGVNYLTIAVN